MGVIVSLNMICVWLLLWLLLLTHVGAVVWWCGGVVSTCPPVHARAHARASCGKAPVRVHMRGRQKEWTSDLNYGFTQRTMTAIGGALLLCTAMHFQGVQACCGLTTYADALGGFPVVSLGM